MQVIDGELVYKVNKSTIKKITVTYGPSVKLSSLQSQSESGKQEPDSSENTSQEPVSTESTATVAEHREPISMDWFVDSDSAEKENIEHFSEGTRNERDGTQKTINKVRC